MPKGTSTKEVHRFFGLQRFGAWGRKCHVEQQILMSPLPGSHTWDRKNDKKSWKNCGQSAILRGKSTFIWLITLPFLERWKKKGSVSCFPHLSCLGPILGMTVTCHMDKCGLLLARPSRWWQNWGIRMQQKMLHTTKPSLPWISKSRSVEPIFWPPDFGQPKYYKDCI